MASRPAPDGSNLAAAIRQAAERIAPHRRLTPLIASEGASSRPGRLLLKCENLQVTGSFKVRGALNRLLTLPTETVEAGVITASTGNHGAAVAHAAAIAGTSATVVVPHGADAAKLAAIERRGGSVLVHGRDSVEAEAHARDLAAGDGRPYVSPYNDLEVIAGQGTIGLEVLETGTPADVVYVAVGGGGLAAGVATMVKSISPRTRVIGCSPSASAVMYHSLRAGQIVSMPSAPTLSDGTAGGVEPGSVTFPILAELLDDFLLVDEDAIRTALLELIEQERLLVEGSAAMAYAAARRHHTSVSGDAVVILCGGNISGERLRDILRPHERGIDGSDAAR